MLLLERVSHGSAYVVVPRTLAENAGLNAMSVLSSLYASHDKGETSNGVDVREGATGVLDAKAEGILDHLIAKQQAIRLAADAACTVLRVDQIIMSKPAGGPAPRQPGPMDGGD